MLEVTKENKNVLILDGLTIFILSLFFVIYPPLRIGTGIYIGILLIGFVFYSNGLMQSYLKGMTSKNAIMVSLLGIGSGIGFIVLTKIVPFFSIFTPDVPMAIGDDLKWLIIVIVAPIAEEIFFRGALMGFIKWIKPDEKGKWIAILVQGAIAFPLFHLAAYVSGFYMYPSWLAALGATTAVIGSFLGAMVWGTFSGWVVSKDGVNNLLFCIIGHMVINAALFSASIIVFSILGVII
jgi:membrane protease YdiL (CAAX protease family)